MKLVTLKQNPAQLARVEGDQLIPFEFAGGMLGLIEAGSAALEMARQASGNAIPLVMKDLAVPVRPSKIIAIGKNYAEHAKESGSEIPQSPIVFTKFTTSLIGYGEEITWRSELTKKVDFEAELAVVIGRTARHVSSDEALDYVFGYSCGNDMSARDLQFGDKQWIRGKSLDTFCPLGPWIVTADEIPNPQTLDIRCVVNNKEMQSSNTQHMIFDVAYLISFLSQAFTLLPGDIILSGTPDGVGVFRDPPSFLGEGDEIVVEIENVGRLINRCHVV